MDQVILIESLDKTDEVKKRLDKTFKKHKKIIY